MKKFLLLFIVFCFAQNSYCAICSQTFTASGPDSDPTVLTINASDITCNVGNTINSLTLVNSAESISNAFCNIWYDFTLVVDGGTPIIGCAADINNVDITGFTTLTITSSDLDVFSDAVTIEIDVEVDFATECLSASGSVTSGICMTGVGFMIDVNITDLGDGTVNISNNAGVAATNGVSTLGVTSVGPFPFSSAVTITLENPNDAICNLVLSPLSLSAACPPPEDNCMGAINIPVTPDDCTGLTTGNNTGATDSNNDEPAPPAATCNGYAGGDIWFSLTVPTSGNVTISGGPSPGCCSFLWYEVYTGSGCGALTSIMCSSTAGNDPSGFETFLTGQTPGATIWIRAWDSNNDNGPGDFNFCAKEVIPAENNECTSATTIIESSDANCNNTVSSSTLNATASANNNCSQSAEVWFELQAVSSNITITSTNLAAAGSSGVVPVSTVIMVFESCTGSSIACGFSPVSFDAIPGNTYFIATTTRSAGNATTPATFDLCAYPTPQPPVNDECADAETVIQSNSIGCENAVPGTTYFSTFSPENICAGGGNDVWYSFVATSSTVGVLVNNLEATLAGGVPANAVVGVFSGACGSFTQLSCVFNQTEIPVTIGDTYHVSVTCRNASNFPVFADFDVCVYTPAPDNNDCADATDILDDGTSGAGALPGELFAGATPSGLGAEDCDSDNTVNPADVWYRITTGGAGTLIVNVLPGGSSDVVMALYNACGDPVANAEACGDLGGDGSPESVNVMAALQNQKGTSSTRADEFFLRIYEKSPSGESFSIETQGSALPIELSSFEATAVKRGNNITWTTLSEINSDYVEVQSSPNGSTRWETIGKVQMQGESYSKVDYAFFDNNPYEVTYYRLHSVDKDERSEMSQSITVRRIEKVGKMILSPNPANSILSLQTISSTDMTGTILIYDMTGVMVQNESINLKNGLNTLPINIEDLASGIYLLSLKTDDGVQIEKIIKQ